MRRLITLLAIGSAGAISYVISKQPKETEAPKTFEWISAEESEEEYEEPLPMFYVGDTVQLFNPYEGGFIISGMFSMEPERYRIVDVRYDKVQSVFRYRLKPIENPTDDLGGGVAVMDEYGYEVDEMDEISDELWYSEEWLSLPSVSNFVSRKAASRGAMEELSEQQEKLWNEITEKAMDNDLREREIDRMLDIMRTGTEEERDTAKAELAKMTEGGD